MTESRPKVLPDISGQMEQAKELQAAITRRLAENEVDRAVRNQLVRDMRRAGHSHATIAKGLNITTTRVQQLLLDTPEKVREENDRTNENRRRRTGATRRVKVDA